MNHYINDNSIGNLNSRECFANGYASVLTTPVLMNMLTGKRGTVSDSLEQYHFLSSSERFNACKKAFTQLSFTHINFNLMSEIECHQLAVILRNSNAIFTLCNFTNIHDYDKDEMLKITVPLLLDGSPNCFIMYATHMSNYTNISNKIEDYFNKFDIEDAKLDDLDLPDDFFITCQHHLKPSSDTVGSPRMLRSNYFFTTSVDNSNHSSSCLTAIDLNLSPVKK